MSDQGPEPPDLDEIPNFNALAQWFSRLRAWCIAAQTEIKKLNDKVSAVEADADDLRQEVHRLESEAREAEGDQEMVADVMRGVRDLGELADHFGVVL